MLKVSLDNSLEECEKILTEMDPDDRIFFIDNIYKQVNPAIIKENMEAMRKKGYFIHSPKAGEYQIAYSVNKAFTDGSPKGASAFSMLESYSRSRTPTSSPPLGARSNSPSLNGRASPPVFIAQFAKSKGASSRCLSPEITGVLPVRFRVIDEKEKSESSDAEVAKAAKPKRKRKPLILEPAE